MTKNPVRIAIDNMGGPTKAREALGLKTRVTLYNWMKKRVPAERVLDLERLSGVSRHDIRPDLYPRGRVK